MNIMVFLCIVMGYLCPFCFYQYMLALFLLHLDNRILFIPPTEAVVTLRAQCACIALTVIRVVITGTITNNRQFERSD